MAVDLSKVNYILLNEDGSVYAQSMDYYVQQGSTNVDKIFFGKPLLQDTDIGLAVCTLPNGQQNTLIGIYDEATFQGVTYSGFLFTLTSQQTNYNGSLMMSLAVYRGDKRIVSYPLCVIINETGLRSDTDTGVTIEEINSYLQILQSKLSIENGILVVDSMSESVAEDRVLGQIFFSRTDGTFYIKNSNTSPYYQAYPELSFVIRTSEAYKVYGTGTTGGQITITWSQSNQANSIARRKSNGNLSVAETPTANDDAASKKYVDDSIEELKTKGYQLVDTTVYPTLLLFLASTGEEGYIYLYPINTSDLTKGYNQYIWENNNWLYLGTTQIDLTNYYTKSQADDKFVAKTNNAKQLYGTDVNGAQTTYTITTSVMTGQVPQRDESGDVLVPTTPTSSSAAVSKSYVDTTFLKEGYSGYHQLSFSEISEDSSDNLLIENLGNNVEIYAYNGDVLIQQRNVIQELDQLKAEFYEAVVEIKDYEMQGLYSYPIPSSISGQVTLYSAGLDIVYLFGASIVMNQRINATGASGDYGVSATCSGTHVTLSGTSTYSGGDRNLYLNTSPVAVISGHKYLVFSTSNEWCLFTYGSGQSSSASASQEIFTANANENVAFSIFPLSDSVITNGNVINAQFDVYFIDLTLMYGCNANIPASLLSTPADFFKLYNGSLAYSTPTIRSSCPTKIDTVGLNQWDEETEEGIYNTETGAKVSNSSYLRSKNMTRVVPNTAYFYHNSSGNDPYAVVLFYDKNGNYLYKAVSVNKDTTFWTPVNCFYIAFYINDTYGTTYLSNVCINVSNASFNGNYAPYTKDERTLQNPPILKGIRNSCNDDTTFRATNIVNLAGLSWTYDSNNKQFYSDEIDDALDNINSGWVPVLCSAYAYNSDGYNVDSTPHVRGIIGKRLYIVDETLNGDASFIKGRAVYQLATPVRQTYVELPKDMKISAGGTINVTYGDADNNAPLYSIYTQIATVK